MPRVFDAIVIGAGPAGEVSAAGLAAEGLEVAMIERELVGDRASRMRVGPRGVAWAATAAPNAPLAPTRFSTMIGVFNTSDSR